ncbi:MAG: uracil-DNA glycosylase family protein [Steroidobacteraceae bacterium]
MPTGIEPGLTDLLHRIRACTACAQHLPLGPRPVLRAASGARLLIVGQAPGTRVHTTGIPWNDPSGDRLREWLALDREVFYDESRIAIIPMGFCYPGKGRSGDLPPRPECAPLWHGPLMRHLPNLRLALLVGSFAQRYYLQERRASTLGETVRRWRDYQPQFAPLPHPSPRNRRWLKINAWFETDVVPQLRQRVQEILHD